MILSIIIPVFNEERTIRQLIEKVSNVKLTQGLKKEIIVINDGSTDRTLKHLKQLGTKIKVINHAKNLGKGAAVRTGISYSTGDILVIQDADLEYDPQDFNRLVEPILKNQYQVVYGTRLKDYPLKLWGKDKTPLPTHYLGNKLLTALTNFLFSSNLTDMETCYKLFKKEVLVGIDLKSNKFDIEPELTAKILKKGNKICDLPIKTQPRSFKEGKKINWKDGFSAIKALIKYRFVD